MGGNREVAERFIATLEARDWDAWAGLLHPAVVYEMPQSRERIRGRDRYLRFNQEYPGDWHLRPKVMIADERHGVVWFEWRLDDRIDDGMAFFEFTDGLITRVTDFWPEPYEPPPGREHLVERWQCDPRRAGTPQSAARPGRPGRKGPLESLTVQDDVDPLIEESNKTADLCRVVQRVLVGPGKIGELTAVKRRRPV